MSTTVSERCPHCGEGSVEPGQHCGKASRGCTWWRCSNCKATIGPDSYFVSEYERKSLPEGESGTYRRSDR